MSEGDQQRNDRPAGGYPPPPSPYGYGRELPLRPDEERTWAMWSHLGALLAAVLTGILGFVPPLVIMQSLGRRSGFVRDQAVESLNFQLFLLLAVLAGVVLSIVTLGIGAMVVVPLLGALLIAALIFMIMATLAANRGEPYRYPVNIRMVK